MDFFESLAISGIYEKEGFPSFCYCHGSPASSREYLSGEKEKLEKILKDLDAVVKEFERSELDQKAPWWTKLNIHLLYTGEDFSASCIMLARKQCEEAGEEINGLDIPEKYMEMAVKKLEIKI